MNQLATQQERIPMDSVGVSNTGTGTKIAPQNLGEVVKFAEVMCRADIALPKHLRGNAGACMAVAMQALEWQLSPFAVASKSYSVNGTIAYEAQLIAAVVNTRSGIKGRLKYSFEGEGAALKCTVTGILDGEECVYTSPPIGSITTKNSPLWKSDPQQQLGYFAARSWARRHCPEVILGVYDRDEAEEFRGPERAKDITPSVDIFSDEPALPSSEATDAQEGFPASFVQSETETALRPDIAETETLSGEDLLRAGTADEDRHSSSDSEPADESPAPASAGSSDPETENETLIRYAKDVLPMAANPETTGSALAVIEKEWASDIKKLSEDGQTKARSISSSMRAIFNQKTSLESALDYFAEVLACSVADLGGVNG